MTIWHHISPDIIHAHDFDSAYMGLMLKTAFETPLIFTYHRAPNPWKDFKFQEDAKDCFLEVARIYNFFDSVVVPSKINRDILIAQKFNPQKIKIIKHGVEIKFLSSFAEKESILARIGFDSSKTMIMCPIRFDSHKNAEVFLKAASVLKKETPNEKFIFVLTDKPEGFYDHIPGMASKLGLGVGSDLFLEQFGFKEMKTLYKNAAVCVVPSLQESFGQTVIESFVYKTPVIASNSGALPEIIKHKKNGLLFTPNSHEDLVAQVRTILSNPDLSKRLVENALEDAKTNYTSERMITEYIDLYEEVIKKKAACRGLRFRTHPSSKSLI
ncbi:MAG: hypothetical protein QG657_4254 [Acidobacteriota bacterium]|nr:hypothetical protein [Acidobacteriota bacterium]